MGRSPMCGAERMILGGLALFIAGSIGCALSQDLPRLLAFRALQGLSAGVGMIVGRAMIRDLFNGPDAQRLMRHVSMIFGIAPAIAPIIGGWILLSGAGWPLIFRFLVVFGLVLLVATIHAASEAGRRRLRLAMHSCHRRHDPGCVLVRVHGAMRQIRIGSICCGVAALVDLAYTFAVAQIALPWAVLAIFLTGLGMALIFPILALADMYPQQRGLASLLQAFTQLMTNTVVAGVLSPLLSEHPRDLAIGMTGFFLLGWLFLRWERRSGRRLRHRQATKAVPLEPADHL